MEKIDNCKNLQKNNSDEGWRACFLKSVKDIKTAMGAIVAAGSAYVWLERHPADEKVKAVALSAIQNGRLNVMDEKLWLYDTLDEVAVALNKSITYRMIYGVRGDTNTSATIMRRLNDAEYSILLPNVARNQNQLLLKIMTDK